MDRLYNICHSLLVKRNMCTVGYARTNIIGSRTSFVIASVLAYIEMYVLRGDQFQGHSLEKSYLQTQTFEQEKCNTKSKNISEKNNIKLIYLTFIHCTNKQITELN